MTVSTAGIVPRIHDFGQEPVRPKLAISLNGSNDALRSEVMPLNRKWNLAELMKAAREFPLRTRERMTFEYVLIEGVNDAPEQAREVVELVRGMRAKINLIALNPGPELPYRTPEQERVAAFQQILVAAGIPAFVRRPRGRDIFAACGQLKRTVQDSERPVLKVTPSTSDRSSELLRAARPIRRCRSWSGWSMRLDCSSIRNAGFPVADACTSRPPCSSTMRQQALNESVDGRFAPSELNSRRNRDGRGGIAG